jgi:hypothetical protein
MKKFFFFLIVVFVLISSFTSAQDKDTLTTSEWNFGVETDFYFTDPFVFLPIFTADKNKLHLEVRYNYEDLKTVSAWIGYNISGGNEFEYIITPMVGGAAGRTNGIVTGLEFTFSFIGFELYNESEYLFDFKSSENNFFYSWTDFTYSPLDWLWVGLSGQITGVYQTELEIERGVLLGVSYQNFEFTGYYYNAFSDDDFLTLALAAEF